MENETAEKILRDHLGDDLYNELDKSFIYPQPSGKFPITDLLKSAMKEAATHEISNVEKSSGELIREDLSSQYSRKS